MILPQSSTAMQRLISTLVGDHTPAGPLAGLHKHMTGREDSGSEEARKIVGTARVGVGVRRRFTLAREGRSPIVLR
jgi:hypothetical protein